MMTTTIVRYAMLAIATFPFIYYLLVLYSSWRFFRRPVTLGRPRAGQFHPSRQQPQTDSRTRS